MPIASSIITSDSRQTDGRRSISERHIDSAGKEYQVSYLCDAVFDTAAALAARVTALNSQMKDSELKGLCTTSPWDCVLQDVTLLELRAYVRTAYKNGSRDDLAVLAKRILEWINNGRFTDAQFTTAFGLTSAQWTALKTRMQTLVNSKSTVDSAVGE